MGIINKSHDKAILSDASQILSSAKIAIADGACGKTGDDATTITCTATQLAPYVEGVSLAETAANGVEKAEVIKTNAGYELTYTGFDNF